MFPGSHQERTEQDRVWIWRNRGSVLKNQKEKTLPFLRERKGREASPSRSVAASLLKGIEADGNRPCVGFPVDGEPDTIGTRPG